MAHPDACVPPAKWIAAQDHQPYRCHQQRTGRSRDVLASLTEPAPADAARRGEAARTRPAGLRGPPRTRHCPGTVARLTPERIASTPPFRTRNGRLFRPGRMSPHVRVVPHVDKSTVDGLPERAVAGSALSFTGGPDARRPTSAPVAQRTERRFPGPEVAGSSPAGGTARREASMPSAGDGYGGRPARNARSGRNGGGWPPGGDDPEPPGGHGVERQGSEPLAPTTAQPASALPVSSSVFRSLST